MLPKILLIGSNPSMRAESTEAFSEDTLSGRILRRWLENIEGEFVYDNISAEKTENNRPLTKAEKIAAGQELKQRIKNTAPDHIVALGKSAAGVLENLGLDFFEMPHPSGLNRKLNDKQYVASKLAELKRYCESIQDDPA